MVQKGFSSILVIVLVVIVLAGVAFFLLRPINKNQKSSVPSQTESRNDESSQNSNEPPLKLKSIGVNFEDFKFTKEKLQFGKLFMEYGFVIPGSQTSNNKDKANPQPTYIIPDGTSVRSLVDGVVVGMPTLWSGDLSIQVAVDEQSKWRYETEHVINPKVKVGDRVSAGQVIAQPSNFDKGAPEGFATVEIGILKGGQEPEHVCPFAYLDDSIKEETFTKMRKLFKDWEEYLGDQTLYDESNPILGCITLDPIKG